MVKRALVPLCSHTHTHTNAHTHIFRHERPLMQDNNNSPAQPLRHTWMHTSMNTLERSHSTHTMSSPLHNAYTASSPLQLSCQAGATAHTERAEGSEEGAVNSEGALKRYRQRTVQFSPHHSSSSTLLQYKKVTKTHLGFIKLRPHYRLFCLFTCFHLFLLLLRLPPSFVFIFPPPLLHPPRVLYLSVCVKEEL